MMRSKRYSRNTANPALLFSFLIITILPVLFCGCAKQIEPTYKEKDIPYTIKKICKDEYKVDVVTKVTPTVIWVYLPLHKLLHKDYGAKEDKIFDEELMDKLRNIMNTVGRVVLSADHTPEFFAILASDINLGIDYTVIGNVLDIKKAYAAAIPWTEINRRYVLSFNLNPKAIGDTQGSHLITYDIRLEDFLAEQIAERIIVQFQENGLKEYFKLDKCEGRFNNGVFVIGYSIKEIAKPEKNIYRDADTHIIKKILNTAGYCIKTYEFRDFSSLEIVNLPTQDRFVLSKAEVWARPTD